MTDLHAPILDVNDVSCEFKLNRGLFRRQILRAVDRVSFRLREKETLAIAGESGSGKTTLSKIVLGMLKPSTGQVILDGKPIEAWSRMEIARYMQVVFQDPYSSLNPRRQIGSIVARPLEIHGIGDAAKREKRAREMLGVVGLPNRVFDAYPEHLSGGQRQRVVIARALILRPRIVICDEPTSALDVSVQAQILNLLLDLRSDFGLSYIFISHDLAVVEHMATDVAIMYLGRIVEQGSLETVFGDPRHPYTRDLLSSIVSPDPEAGIPRARGRYAEDARAGEGCPYFPRCADSIADCRSVAPPVVGGADARVVCHRAGEARH